MDDVPFHPGEQAVQQRVGVRERMASTGRRTIRSFMPDQHRAFFAQLPMLFVGSLDGDGRPWASVLSGPPGFATSPDPVTLRIAAEPVQGDPLNGRISEGRKLGLLGLEFHTRRRNRMNGRIIAVEPGAFSVGVEQSFGNCPQYIRPRTFIASPAPEAPRRVEPIGHLDGPVRAQIETAATFFIASRYGDDYTDPRHGIDVSHRGGDPGFVVVEDDRTLVWPDYRGNFYFNTLGNLHLDPRCGLLFPDFETGDGLLLTGRAEIVWNDPMPANMDGAERDIRFRLDEGLRIDRLFPLEA